MKCRDISVTAAIMAMPLAAIAQPVTGLYIGGGAGINIMQEEHSTRSTRLGSSGADLNTRVGPAVSASIGYGFGNGFRTEIEGDYRFNTFDGASFGNKAGGQEQKYGPMVNVLYDFVGLVPVVQPYVGVGAGYQWVKVSNNYTANAFNTARINTGSEGAFAYQAIIGAALPITAVAGLALTADYRFMGLAGDRTYSGTVTTGAGTVPASFKRDGDYNHAILVGVRYAFGAAPMPAPMAPASDAVPASPISRSYLVFFDWDKAVLTDRARQIVSEAAANTAKVQFTQIEVDGYTDTSGTPKYNQRLSMRRAQTVAAELVKDGVAKSAISIQGFGETHLLVQTGMGVREPQNRRVEIIIK